MNFIEELRWRGLIQDLTPGLENVLQKGPCTGYIGFDPTSASLHVGSLVQIKLLQHFQRAGHKPIALIGGATGMIGDPSGKPDERKLLSAEEIRHHETCMKKQLEKFLDFDSGKNSAELVNNHDWFGNINLISFLRDFGKHLTISYMLTKDSVKNRTGMSFTEFSYQLMQAYDFLYLYQNKNCTVQMGGSDQWGNITAGIELIRKKCSGDGFGITSPLMLKSDGAKFGKTEEGNIWLDAKLTSPYRFYQFWLNISDAEAAGYIRVFSFMEREEIEGLEKEHAAAPEKRLMQKALAKEVTTRVHSEDDFQRALHASELLFLDGSADTLRSLSEEELLEVFREVPHARIARSKIEEGITVLELLADATGFFPSRGEARRNIKGGGVAINREKVQSEERTVSAADLLNGKYILLQRGKKNYCFVKAE